MPNQKDYSDSNFQAGDSPFTINIKLDLGDISVRAVIFINFGPGIAQIEVSYNSGITFEDQVLIPPGLSLAGGGLDDIDQLRITHLGIDFSYDVFISTSTHPLSLTSIDLPEIHFAGNYFSKYLLDGGTINMSVDGSITPVEYSFTVPTDTRIRVSYVDINLEDGVLAFDPQDFGDINNGLINGLEVSNTPDSQSKIVLENWLTNRDVIATVFDAAAQFKQAGDVSLRWDLGKILGSEGLYLNDGDKFSVLVQDDLEPLSFLSIRLLGRTINV